MVSLEQDQAQSLPAPHPHQQIGGFLSRVLLFCYTNLTKPVHKCYVLAWKVFLSHWSTTTGCCWQLCQAGVASAACASFASSTTVQQSSSQAPALPFQCTFIVISSDRSSYSDNGLLYIRAQRNFFRFSLSPLMQLMLQVSL